MISSALQLAIGGRGGQTQGRAPSLHPDVRVDAARRRVDVARRLYAERRGRERAFGALAAVFRDPAWDIALDLFVAGEEGRSVSASSASIASKTPMSTGLRCIDRMVDAGVLVRSGDPGDARRSLISLTPEGRACMARYLDEVT